MDKIAIVGGAGFIGRHLAVFFSRKGHDVFVIDKDRKGLENIPFPERQKICFDLSSFPDQELVSRLRDVRVIINCACASSSSFDDFDIMKHSLHTTENAIILGKCLDLRKFIQISGASVYRAKKAMVGMCEEAICPDPLDMFVRCMRVGEGRVVEAGIPYTILRIQEVYGKNRFPFLSDLGVMSKTGYFPSLKAGKPVCDILHINDLETAAEQVVLKKERSNSKVYNVSGGAAVPIRLIVETFADHQGSRVIWKEAEENSPFNRIDVIERVMRRASGLPRFWASRRGLSALLFSQTVDITKIEMDLGWSPSVSFEEGVIRTFGRLSDVVI